MFAATGQGRRRRRGRRPCLRPRPQRFGRRGPDRRDDVAHPVDRRPSARAEPAAHPARDGRAGGDPGARRSCPPRNLTDVSVLASIIAIAAVGEAMVVITRNVDLSVEAVIGLVAFVVADILGSGALPTPVGDAGRDRPRPGARDDERVHRRGAACPVDRRDAGHPEHLSGASTSCSPAGSRSRWHVAAGRVHGDRPLDRSSGIPVFVLVVVAIVVVVRDPASRDPLRAIGLRRRQQPGGGRDPRHQHAHGHVRRVLAVRPPGRGRRRDVGDPVRDDQRDVGVGGDPAGDRGGRGRRRQHLRRLGHRLRRRARRAVPGLRRPTR